MASAFSVPFGIRIRSGIPDFSDGAPTVVLRELRRSGLVRPGPPGLFFRGTRARSVPDASVALRAFRAFFFIEAENIQIWSAVASKARHRFGMQRGMF